MAWAVNRPVAGTAQSLPARLFPADNWWNLRVADAPLDPRSAALIEHERTYGGRLLDAHPTLRYDWGNNYGLPFCTVGGDHPTIRFQGGSYWGESDDVPYPIPVAALREPGWTEDLYGTIADPVSTGDRHLLIVDVDHQVLYEIYQPRYNATGAPLDVGGHLLQPGAFWCASAAHWDLTSNATRPEGWTSSDAAGLQVLPGLVQYDEVTADRPITHAHRLCLYGNTSDVPQYVWPATHHAGSWNPGAAPLGTRFRLRADFNLDLPNVGPAGRRLLQAFKDYGLIFADNGGHGMVTGTNDPRWGAYDSPIRTEMSYALGAVALTDLEVVQLGWRPDGPIVIPPDPPPPPPQEMTLDEALATIDRIAAELTSLRQQVIDLEATHADDAAQIAALTLERDAAVARAATLRQGLLDVQTLTASLLG